MRLFVGIPVSQKLRDHLIRSWSELPEKPGKYRPTPPENWHLTLCFLDEVAEEKVPTLVELVSQSTQQPPQGVLLINRFETFPAKHPSHVTARAFPEQQESWKHFVTQLCDFCSLAAPRVDRKPWFPHVSIGRAERGAVLPAWQRGIETFEWKPEEFCLMKSTLTSQGSVYECLEKISFDL